MYNDNDRRVFVERVTLIIHRDRAKRAALANNSHDLVDTCLLSQTGSLVLTAPIDQNIRFDT